MAFEGSWGSTNSIVSSSTVQSAALLTTFLTSVERESSLRRVALLLLTNSIYIACFVFVDDELTIYILAK